MHFMGIGGVGMCGLAEIITNEGIRVTGCDLAESERTARLRELGIDVAIGHDAAHLDDADALVVTSAVSRLEPEVVAALERGLAVVRRAELLAEIMRSRQGVAVAGTHGKTTTTSLIAHLTTSLGLDPTVVVGGRALFMDGHARVGSGRLLVCEADEFDRSFLELGPRVAVVTNLEPEHLECYDGVDDLEGAFAAFANRVSALGGVILCADDPGSWGLRPAIRRRVVGYGLSDEAHLRLEVRSADARGTHFTVFDRAVERGGVFVPLPGAFNALNALGAIAACLDLELEFADLAEACADFRGVARRFERRGERDGVAVVDDYAHHPTELAAVFQAARQALPGRRIVAVFQPHLYSRTRDFAREFAEALMQADVAVVLPIYPAREQPINGVSSTIVVEHAQELGHPAVVEGASLDEAVPQLEEIVRTGDVLLTIGAGDVDRLATAWMEGSR
jgi:UDP-N-acetylmuramate--alanine ligase